MAWRPVGPCTLYMGDPTVGSGMTSLGDTEDVAVNFGVRSAWVSSAQKQGVPLADSTYVMVPEPAVTAQLTDAQNATLKEIILGAVETSVTLGIGDTFSLIASLPTLFILPETEVANGVNSVHGIWIPAAIPSGVDGISFGRVSPGEILQPYNVTFNAAFRTEDQTSPTPVAIPAGNRILFKGPPSELGLSWSL